MLKMKNRKTYFVAALLLSSSIILASCGKLQPKNDNLQPPNEYSAQSGENSKSPQATDGKKPSGSPAPTAAEPSSTVTSAIQADAPDISAGNVAVYKNAKYGFNFTLPASWKGYTIIEDTWQGLSIDGDSGEKVTETGPLISIRHPGWTEQNPRQDIPIMVFTIDQWNSLQNSSFHIGAAPIGPSELGRNSKYVFALPARYNYAFPAGYEEVEKILSNSPLTPVEPESD